MLFSTVGIIILAIVLLTIQFSKTEYEVAFTNLDSTDAAGIIEYLEGGGIPYQLGADGTSISVPSKDASRVKIGVGSQGIVENGSIGWEAFSEGSSLIGMTDNEFNVKYKSALNGEIEQLLKRMSGIQDAKVFINLPAENVFASLDEREKASASVVVTFKPGYRPDQEAVDGYFNLVKTSVPNLPIENISLSSSDDTILLPTGENSPGQIGSLTTAVQENLALQKKFESDVKQSVKQFLSRLMGQDKVEVLVNSKLNFDQISQKENLVTPVDTENIKGIEISAERIQKSYTGQDASESGVAGTGETDVANYPAADNNGTTTSSEESSSTINYEVNRITKDIVASPYVIKDLTINVAVEPPEGQESLDTDTQSAIENVLANIVGSYLADSGSTYTDDELLKKVSVLSQAFYKDEPKSSGFSLSSPLVWGALAAALLAIAGVVFILVRRGRKQPPEEIEEEIPVPLTPEFPSINLDTVTNENQVRKQLETLAKKKPDEFVNLLRTWLADE